MPPTPERVLAFLDHIDAAPDEVLAEFEVLDPLEAEVDGWLLEQIAQTVRTIMQGTELVLIRWKDGTESLVVLRAGH